MTITFARRPHTGGRSVSGARRCPNGDQVARRAYICPSPARRVPEPIHQRGGEMAKSTTKTKAADGPVWPARKIDMRSIHDLEPYARNARTHSPEQVDQIAASIQQFGWTIPVLIDEADAIIAGHGRVLAAAKLGIEDVPCMVAVGWTEAQKRAYVIADNKLSLNAGWDEGLLREELAALGDLGFDLGITGFSQAEIDAMFGDAGDMIDLTAGGDASSSGVNSMTLKFDGVEVPLGQDEVDGLKARLQAHVNIVGSHFGFVRSLLSTRNA